MNSNWQHALRARCWLIFSAAIVGASITTSVEAGQTAVAASIIGQVTDQSGGALPGVTVTATSPALQVPQVTEITGATGEYRLTPLPIGAYELTFELAGFQTSRRPDVRLTSGFTARIDVQLGIAALGETVIVSGEAPVVDVSSTAGSTLLTRELLEIVPNTRNGTMSMLEMAPGVRSVLDVGGDKVEENPSSRVFGQGGLPYYTFEGVPTSTASAGGSNGTFWDHFAIEEARVQTLGTDAENPTRGVQVNAIVKAGGNQFHGAAFWAQTNKNFQSNNIDAELAAVGITKGNPLEKQYDYAGELGGRIVPNKLWFFGAARQRGYDKSVFEATKPDGSTIFDTVKGNYYTGKISYQATPGNRFMYVDVWQRNFESNGASEFVAYESRDDRRATRPIHKVEWQGVRGSGLVASVLAGAFRHSAVTEILDSTKVGRTDLETMFVTGEAVTTGETTTAATKNIVGSLSWYKSDWLGNHDFKAGLSFTTFEYNVLFVDKGNSGNYHLLYNSGVPFQVAFLNYPVDPDNDSQVTAAFLKDSWVIKRRLTLNLGFRYQHENAFAKPQCRVTAGAPADVIYPAQCFPRAQLPIFDSVAPRLHAAYDITGDGRTVLKGGWGRYQMMRLITPDVHRINKNVVQYAIFEWKDLNSNNDWDVGESSRDLNAPDFVRTTSQEFGANTPNFVVNPDEKQGYSDEFIVTLERELLPRFSIRATAIYSRNENIMRINNNLRPFEAYNVPVTNVDPGPDGVASTLADNGPPVTYYEFPLNLVGARFEEFMPISDPAVAQTYKSFEVAGTKRFANRWQFMASVSGTKKHQPIIAALAPAADRSIQSALSIRTP